MDKKSKHTHCNTRLNSKWDNMILAICTLLMITGCNRQSKEKLTIATAANMQYAMQELTQVFTLQTGIVCETIIGSSGKLSTQIQQGAPFDVFIAADMDYPTTLSQNNLTLAPPKVYGFGNLVLWTMTPNITPTMNTLTDPAIHHIALANPKTAPYGRASLETLQHLGILEKINSKLVYGESISQTSQFIMSQAAAIGFTAKSVVVSPEIKDKGYWTTVDKSLYTPIAQGAVILKNREKHLKEAQKFYNFLFSNSGKAILNTFGFTTTTNKDP